VLALEFSDDKAIEIHGDISTGNFFRNAQTVENGFDGIIDYRLEAHAELAKLGEHRISSVVRAEGFGFYDGSSAFFDDPLIDLPELYIQDDFKIKDMDSKLVFGKFANRRFFDKNEIMSDPFDIGERPFFSALANNNNVLSSIQTTRDSDQLNSIQATGSYGFMWSIKDNDGDGFRDRWGMKQSFEVASIGDFGNTYYGITEINKNWGHDKPGQFDVGILYGQNDVFRSAVAPSTKEQYFFYTSITQKITSKLTAYSRYGLLTSTDTKGEGFSENNIVSGLSYKITNKDSFGSHLLVTESDIAPNWISHLNAWTHKFNDHFYGSIFNTYRYNVPAATADGGDNNWFIGFNLTAYF